MHTLQANSGLQAANPVDLDGIIGVVDQLVRVEEERHKKRLTDLQNIVGVIRDVAANSTPLPMDLALALAASKRRRAEVSPIRLIRAAAEKFGLRPFSLDDLCLQLETAFPDAVLDREIISRRIYELRTGPTPVIEVLKSPVAEGESRPRLKRKQKLYRYIGPPRLFCASPSGSSAPCPDGS